MCANPASRRRPSRLTALLAVLSLLGAGACTGDAPGPTPPPPPPGPAVATVRINAGPTTPVVIGTTVQLHAEALDASGAPVGGRSFLWSSSTPAVATVSQTGFVATLDAGTASIVATTGTITGQVPFDVRHGGTLSPGPSGGTLTLFGGKLSWQLLQSQGTSPTTFLFRVLPNPLPSDLIQAGTVFEVDATAPFQGIGDLSIRFEPSLLPAGVFPSYLELYRFINGQWQRQGGGIGAGIPPNTVTGSVELGQGFPTPLPPLPALFAVGGTPVTYAEITGPLAGGAMYVGKQTTLIGTALNLERHPVNAEVVSWSSSNTARATVQNGVVTGIDQGPVTITFTADSRIATTELNILPPVVADWSQATAQWSTFNGNPAQTGYVDASLDPTVFTERWVRQLGLGNVLHRVVTGPGTAFVAAGGTGQVPRLVAVNLANGNPRWSVDLLGVQAVNPPAYGNGSVYLSSSVAASPVLFALDATTGVVRFTAPYAAPARSFEAPVVVDGRVIMPGGANGGLYAFDANSGAQLWFRPIVGTDLDWSPAVSGDLVYSYVINPIPRLEVTNAITGAQENLIADVLAIVGTGPMNPTPVIGPGNSLFVWGGRGVTGFNLLAGSVAWVNGYPNRGRVPTLANLQVLYTALGSLQGRSAGDGQFAWSWSPPVRIFTGPLEHAMGVVLATRNLAFVQSETHTYAVDIASRRHVWSYPAVGEMSLSPEGVLLIAGQDGRLVAITVR